MSKRRHSPDRAGQNKMAQILNNPDRAYKTRPPTPNGILSRLFIVMISNLGITVQRWGQLMADFVTDPRNGVSDNRRDQTSARGNLHKEFSKQQMTWKVFIKALRFLRFVKADFIVVAYDAQGNETIHKTTIHLNSRTSPNVDVNGDDVNMEEKE